MRTRTRAALLALLAALALAGCGAGGSGGPGGSSGGDGSGDGGGHGGGGGTLTVLAAASLTEAFTTLAHDFEHDHPGTHVRLSFDSSATLAEQVDQGAPADVLATADEQTMQTVVDQHATMGKPTVFATNHLVLAVPDGNPAHIERFSDIARPGVKLVVCVASAPCGRLAAQVIAAAGVDARPASEEVDVKAVLSKVELDEADAGLVYATDYATSGGKVDKVDVPTSHQNLNTYPIAALADARQPRVADAWVRLVTSPAGRRVLAADGFGKP